MRNSLNSAVLLVVMLLTSCTEHKLNEPQIEKKEPIPKEGIEPFYLYLDQFPHSNITLECFDLNVLKIKDKDQFVYGRHYFCDEKNAEIGGALEVFANGVVKINHKIEILQPFMIYGKDMYYMNGNYVIRTLSESLPYKKGSPKIKITVFDLKRKVQCTSSFYFSWFCEA
jgi:hypothetical protein